MQSDITGKNGGLDGGTIGDGLIRVNGAVRFLPVTIEPFVLAGGEDSRLKFVKHLGPTWCFFWSFQLVLDWA